MAKAVVQFHFPTPNPTIEQAAGRLGIAPSEIDAEFGVIETDPVAGHYTVLLDAAAAARAAEALKGSADPAEGVFSNPEQELLGPGEDPEPGDGLVS